MAFIIPQILSFGKAVVYDVTLFRLQWESHEKVCKILKTLSIHKTQNLLVYTNRHIVIKVQKLLSWTLVATTGA